MQVTSIGALSWGQVVETQISVGRTFQHNLPFIGTMQEPIELYVSQKKDGWVGVNCVHTKDKPNPHLTSSHIESSAHVLGNGKSIEAVFQANPHYKQRLKANFICVRAEHVACEQVECQNGISTLHFTGGDTYQLLQKDGPATVQDRIITKQALVEAMHNLKTTSMLLLEFTGDEDTISNWPYLTNEATSYLLEKGIYILGVNVPSLDRESDGGMTSNHKLLFADSNRLIVESLALKNLPKGEVQIELKPQKFGDFEDTVACNPVVFTTKF
jgi:kynurenine formamidase